jgi:hypothetical protein
VPNGYDGPERRNERRRAEDVVGWRLGTLEADAQALERRVDHSVSRDELAEILKARDAIFDTRYIPRGEQQQRRDANLRLWLGLISAGQLVLGLVAILHH